MKTIKYHQIVKDEKVLFISPGLFVNKGGMYEYSNLWGAEAERLNLDYDFALKKGYRFESVKKSIEINCKEEVSARKAFIISFFGLFLPSFLLQVFFKEYKTIFNKYDVVHILTASILTYSWIRIIFYLNPKVKIIYTLHDPKSHDERIHGFARWLKEKNKERIENIAMINSNLIIHLHSDVLKKDLTVPIKQVVIHSHPLPVKKAKRIRNSGSKIRIGFMGRIEPYKGLSVLFNAIKSLDKTMNIEVVIVGRGDVDDNWNEVPFPVTLENEMVSDEFFHQTMANLDLIILPYITATQSGVGYMALSYDIPIIATNTGGLPDIIKKSNRLESQLIEANDSVVLCKAISNFVKSYN